MIQDESVGCGNACVAMVAAFHGIDVTEADLRRLHASGQGSNLAALIDAARQIGLDGRAVQVEPDDLRALRLPCVLHWNRNHFVVLERVAHGKADILDPGRGRLRIGMQTLGRHFTGIALELVSAPDEDRATALGAPRLRLRELTRTIGGLPRALGHIALLALSLELLALIMPLGVQIVTDRVVPSHDRDLLTVLALGFFAVIGLHAATNALRSWAIARLGAELTLRWSIGIFRRLLTLPYTFFMRRQLGDIASRFASIDAIQHALAGRMVEGLLDGLLALVTLGLMFAYSPALAALTLAAVMLYTLLRMLGFAPLRSAHQQQLAAAANQQTLFYEIMRGAQAIRLANSADTVTARYANRLVDLTNAQLAIRRISNVFETLQLGFGHGLRIGVLLLGATQVMDGALSIGMLLAFLAYSSQFSQRAHSFVDYLVEVKMLRVHVGRLADITLAEPEPHQQGSDTDRPVDFGLEVQDLSYGYEPGQLLLENVSLRVADGECVALTGPSGCGKSTLARLLLGLLEPSAGSIRVGGVALPDLGKRELRSHIAAVMQGDDIFAGTIAENIAFFDPDGSHDRVEACARAAGVHADILKLPMGYYSLVGGMTSVLSSGQVQRLLLARALYRRPSILILDEATSNLDVATEAQVNATVEALKMTRIIISHRPETVAKADRVVALSHGRLVAVTARAPRAPYEALA